MYPKIALQLCSSLLSIQIGGQIAIPLAQANTPPPADDIPEEVLRAEIITEARSPIDGKPLSAGQFAELAIDVEQQLNRADATAVAENSQVKNILFLLRLRGFLRSVGIPIK